MTTQKTGDWYAHYVIDANGNARFTHHGKYPQGCCDLEFNYLTKQELILAQPKVAQIEMALQVEDQKRQINEEYSTSVTEKHAFKYCEALLWKAGIITDPYQLYQISSDALKYVTGGLTLNDSMNQVADAIIAKATIDVVVETERTFKRAQIG